MIEIKRVTSNKDYTLGVLSINNDPLFFTLEEAWNNNSPQTSCIPIGYYLLKKHYSPKFKECYKVFDLQGREPANRSQILIHAGNTTEDTIGCILLGMQISEINGKKAIVNSRNAITLFNQKMLNITSCEMLIY